MARTKSASTVSLGILLLLASSCNDSFGPYDNPVDPHASNKDKPPVVGPAMPAAGLTDMVLVEGGTFHNGTSNVTVSSFRIGKYEVTQKQYKDVMGYSLADETGKGDSYPEYNISWYDC